MRKIGSSRIGRHAPKPGFTYPTIRLPQDRADTIGETVTLYETSHGGKIAFLIVLDNAVSQTVAQLSSEDKVPNTVQERLNELEKRIRDVEERFLANPPAPSSEGAGSIWARRDSNTRSSPCEGDVIAS